MTPLSDSTMKDADALSPLGGISPADLLRQGAAEDTLGSPTPFQPPALEEVAALFPQFEVLELIGQGGMGAVYKVRQKELDRVVALKILPRAIGETPGFSDRFAREARALAKLNHPGIVTLHEFGQTDGLYFIVMEYVDGVNLRRLMQSDRISPREALTIVPKICDALQFAHDHGIVHRDIKPENVLLDRLGRVKVADFGIAKVMAACEPPSGKDAQIVSPDLTLAGKILGTPPYMAPEQFERPGEVDHRADIYALGVVLYQMLTGELPDKELQAPSKKIHLDVRLDEVVLQALEKNPAMRFQQASVMKTRLENYDAGGPRTTPGDGKKFATRLAIGLIAGTVAVTVGLTVAAITWFSLSKPPVSTEKTVSTPPVESPPPVAKAGEKAPEEKSALALPWLETIDRGDYGPSYRESSAFFRAALTESQWIAALERYRKPLGALVSRHGTKVEDLKDSPGMPKGEHRVMIFETDFANKHVSIETVTFTKDSDGVWRASGYYIR